MLKKNSKNETIEVFVKNFINALVEDNFTNIFTNDEKNTGKHATSCIGFPRTPVSSNSVTTTAFLLILTAGTL
jgi:hypothetical protein